MVEKLCIQQATLCQLDALCQLDVLCFQDPWGKTAWMQEIENPLSSCLIAQYEGQLVGCAAVRVMMDIAEVMRICVAPAFRRRGIAHTLLDRLADLAVRKGANSLMLEVRAGNLTALALYRQAGFSVVGRRARYYQHPQEDAVLMTRDLVVG